MIPQSWFGPLVLQMGLPSMPCLSQPAEGLPGEVHGVLASHAEVEVRGVLHLVGVPACLNPVADGVAVNPVHHVAAIKHAAAVVMGTVA